MVKLVVVKLGEIEMTEPGGIYIDHAPYAGLVADGQSLMDLVGVHGDDLIGVRLGLPSAARRSLGTVYDDTSFLHASGRHIAPEPRKTAKNRGAPLSNDQGWTIVMQSQLRNLSVINESGVEMSEVIIEATLNRIVDGDTVNVAIDGDSRNRGVRILALDTEEVSDFGGKPETRLGHEATRRAKELFDGATSVRLAIPGIVEFDPTKTGHLDSFGRVLAYLETPDGRDFQEIMIAEGLSPYYQKYGYAADPGRHARYMAAERAAQQARLGVWDQINNNGAVMRDYGTLGVWWDLRARLIDVFRDAYGKPSTVPLLDARIDYEQILEFAKAGRTACVFTEYANIRPTGGPHHLLVSRPGDIRPLDTIIRNTHSTDGEAALTLARTRYMAEGGSLRRSYMYITAPLQMFQRGRQTFPELVVTAPEQITDGPPL